MVNLLPVQDKKMTLSGAKGDCLLMAVSVIAIQDARL